VKKLAFAIALLAAGCATEISATRPLDAEQLREVRIEADGATVQLKP
jgi:hypothetical protein